jgi:hypothetical protein
MSNLQPSSMFYAVRLSSRITHELLPQMSPFYETASHRGGPGSRPVQSMWDVVDKVALWQVSEFFSFPCQYHSTVAPQSRHLDKKQKAP